MKVNAGAFPAAFNGAFGDAAYGGDFGGGEAAEEFEVDDFGQHRVVRCQFVESVPDAFEDLGDLPTIWRFFKKLHRHGAVRYCSEAGPCGFELQCALTAASVECDIIAPALIPRRVADRIKTDRRDAEQLAIVYRAGRSADSHSDRAGGSRA